MLFEYAYKLLSDIIDLRISISETIPIPYWTTSFQNFTLVVTANFTSLINDKLSLCLYTKQ